MPVFAVCVFQALDRLGVGADVRRNGARIQRVSFATLDHKRPINSHSFLRYEQTFGAPSIGITRAALHDTLLQGLNTALSEAKAKGVDVSWPIKLSHGCVSCLASGRALSVISTRHAVSTECKGSRTIHPILQTSRFDLWINRAHKPVCSLEPMAFTRVCDERWLPHVTLSRTTRVGRCGLV
jgi:hypothetical protein